MRSPTSPTETLTDSNPLHGAGRPAALASDLSASFAVIAEQLQNTSRAISATQGPPAAADHLARLDAIEKAQERLAMEVASLRGMLAGKSRPHTGNELPDAAAAASSLADLESRFADALAAQKLE